MSVFVQPLDLFQKKENGMPACAGMTVIVEEYAHKMNRHTREGGCPIWLSFVRRMA